MKTFDGKVAPWYIALFAAMLMAIAGLYVWVVPGAVSYTHLTLPTIA